MTIPQSLSILATCQKQPIVSVVLSYYYTQDQLCVYIYCWCLQIHQADSLTSTAIKQLQKPRTLTIQLADSLFTSTAQTSTAIKQPQKPLIFNCYRVHQQRMAGGTFCYLRHLIYLKRNASPKPKVNASVIFCCYFLIEDKLIGGREEKNSKESSKSTYVVTDISI